MKFNRGKTTFSLGESMKFMEKTGFLGWTVKTDAGRRQLMVHSTVNDWLNFTSANI